MIELVRVYYTLIGVVVLGLISVLSLVLIVMCSFSENRKLAWFWAFLFAMLVLPAAGYLSLVLTGRV